MIPYIIALCGIGLSFSLLFQNHKSRPRLVNGPEKKPHVVQYLAAAADEEEKAD